ncbi:MAG: haloacid dehalogenase [Candidatus Nealsonbacteria bacterium CG18_big_fil_WC_8_21_14_2_50_37_10]|uniref:Haloacid dehalogenase n=1 Tax=Candidatus Nealsonbacteria bacterium CG18_big_fil_WC_8_21_14_2_50_37_10 TaxID=1974717 RepID=A0A2H0FHU2_9BACT|nr:MAG: haloacid dehalogenase [Candidatus Nealsonbacteria bacterium CG18_big_fil_WC_8_21_14_2_50_37_10]
MNKLILFDIDETLIGGENKSHKLSFSYAFKKVYGIDTSIDIIDHPGKTDQQIIIEVLKKEGLSKPIVESKIKECMKVMVDYFNKFINNENIVLLGGVQELLDELNKNGFIMGLVTGNLEDIARGKLKKAGINQYFKVGGFGSDDTDRANLIKLAIKRVGNNFSFKFNNNVFLIGDTPRDMKAGKTAKIKTIGVTTGIYSKEQLKDAGADFIVSNLKEKDEILKIISK